MSTSAEEPGGLAGSVRRRLESGAQAEEVIQELIARGLSRPTAERFVDRAFAEAPSSSAVSEPTPSWEPSSGDSPSLTDLMRNPEGVEASQAYNDLTRGALALAGGIAMTAASFAMPGRARLSVGIIVVGAWLFGRGMVRCSALGLPFPWQRVLASAAIPGAVLAAIGIYIGWGAVQRQNGAQAAAELAAADRSRAEQIRNEAAVQRAIANAERADRRRQRIARALARLDSKQPMSQCEAALELGRLAASEAREPLAALLAFSTASSVRVCAAGALVDLGERDAPLAVYAEWAAGMDDTLQRSAIIGFGEIGPSAVEVALPHLTQALKSPHWDVRLLVVRSLSKLGSAAGPLLRVALEDPHEYVRDGARAALNAAAPGS